LEGNMQALSNLEALRITLGPCDSGFLGSYWTAHGNAAFQALSAHCGRLQKLLLGTSHVTSDGLRGLSCMQRLRHVELHVPGGSVRRPASLAAWLEHLPAQQLTQLVLEPLAGRAAGELSGCRPAGHACSLACGTSAAFCALWCTKPLGDLAHVCLVWVTHQHSACLFALPRLFVCVGMQAKCLTLVCPASVSCPDSPACSTWRSPAAQT
jgi:hypothetical protein